MGNFWRKRSTLASSWQALSVEHSHPVLAVYHFVVSKRLSPQGTSSLNYVEVGEPGKTFPCPDPALHEQVPLSARARRAYNTPRFSFLGRFRRIHKIEPIWQLKRKSDSMVNLSLPKLRVKAQVIANTIPAQIKSADMVNTARPSTADGDAAYLRLERGDAKSSY